MHGAFMTIRAYPWQIMAAKIDQNCSHWQLIMDPSYLATAQMDLDPNSGRTAWLVDLNSYFC